jgi:hypothetical protein
MNPARVLNFIDHYMRWNARTGITGRGAMGDMVTGEAILRLPEGYGRRTVAGYNPKGAVVVVFGHSVLSRNVQCGYLRYGVIYTHPEPDNCSTTNDKPYTASSTSLAA